MQNLPATLPQQNQLATLFAHIFAFTGKKNTITSPLSIYSCLALLAEGCSGHSFQELAAVFGYQSEAQVHSDSMQKALSNLHQSNDTSVVIKMNNSLYVNQKYPLKEDYIKAVQQKHWSTSQNADFTDPTLKDRINQKITEQTGGLIKNCIEDLSKDTLSVLINTIYFKGTWADPFDKDSTRQDDFHKEGGEIVKADFMYKKTDAGFFETTASTYLALPYKDYTTMMVIELPKNKKLTQVDIGSVLTVAKNPTETVYVFIPKFKSEFKCSNLLDLLKNLGIQGVTLGKEMTKMTDHSCALTQVIHQAFIQVDEEGTEAAAATVGMISVTSFLGGPQPKEFRADSPFFYHIVDTANNVVLFSGAVQAPKF